MKKILLIILFVMVYSIKITAQNNLPVLKNSGGKSIALATAIQSNQPTILSFWATWCSPCIQELETIHDLYEDWQKELGVTLFAISIDDSRSQSKAVAMAKGKGWSYEILFDSNQELKRALNIANVPHVVVYYKGKIIYQHSGFTPGSEMLMYNKIKSVIR